MKLVPLSSGHDRNNSGVQFQNALLARGKDRQLHAPFEHLNELIATKHFYGKPPFEKRSIRLFEPFRDPVRPNLSRRRVQGRAGKGFDVIEQPVGRRACAIPVPVADSPSDFRVKPCAEG